MTGDCHAQLQPSSRYRQNGITMKKIIVVDSRIEKIVILLII